MSIYPKGEQQSTPVTIAQGGTGQTSAANARAALDLEPGVDVQVYDANLIAGMSLGECRNVGLTYAANLLTVCQANGSAFANTAGNRGYICVGSSTTGLSVIVPVVANVTITDGDNSQLDASTFGITAGANWDNDAPFFLYFINYNNTSGYFGISRDPTKTITPATCYGYDGGANTQTGMLGLIATASVANIQSKPCVCIGSIAMQWTT